MDEGWTVKRQLTLTHYLMKQVPGWLSLTDLSHTCGNESIISFTLQSRYIGIGTHRLFHAMFESLKTWLEYP